MLTLAGILLLATRGLAEGEHRWIGSLSVVVVVLSAAPFALIYMLAAWGWGRPLAWVLAPKSPNRHWLQLALGFGVLLFISHLLGVFGLLSAEESNEHAVRARYIGWGSVGIGLILLIDQVCRTSLRPEKWPVIPRAVMLLAPAVALLLVAACNPPGWLWSSEKGAYDALSYHLQLPKEWAAGERLWPVQHNVYSFLPSYVEAAYLHLGTLMPGPADPLTRMIDGEGSWILACQMLHAMMACGAAMLAGRAAFVALQRCGIGQKRAAFLGVLAGAVVLSLPWTIVTGSLAYNEAGVLLAFAGGLLAAFDDSFRPWAKGVATGLCAGIAASCKPTSAFLVAPVIGIALLTFLPARKWLFAVLPGAIAGCVAVAPWLIRNADASGNPVFPFAAEQLGMGHWTLEQVARYGRSHLFTGSALDRIGRLFSTGFGLTHDQWGRWLTLIVLGASVIGVALWKPGRKVGVCLLAGVVAQALAWAFLTHLQSRFLLPLIVPVALMFSLLGAALLARFSGGGLSVGGRSLTGAVLAIIPLTFAALSIIVFLVDQSGHPNQALAGGPGAITGASIEDRVRAMGPEEGEKYLKENTSPVGYINTVIRPHETADAGVYLLGDGGPLYVLGASGLPAVGGRARLQRASTARSSVFYHTTWDASPLGKAMLENPRNPRAWTEYLRSMGVRYVLVNFDELGRLIAKDQNYDPSVTIDGITRWTMDPRAGVTLVHAWPHPGVPKGALSGSSLFMLDPKDPEHAGAPDEHGPPQGDPGYARP